MVSTAVLAPSNSDLQLVKLAREIAMDIHPLDTILKQYSISRDTWEILKENGKFKLLLESECEAWNTATNTSERVKLKAAAMLEEWLPELNNRLHDKDEALPAKIEGAKMLTRVAGMGLPGQVEGASPEKFTVTINLGPQVPPVTIEKDVTPLKVIEHEPS